MARTSLKYLLLDLPSDHEVEGALSTECDVIYAVLANHTLTGVTKHSRVVCAQSFERMRPYHYKPEVAHIVGHATEEGLWMLGVVLAWENIARCLAGCLTKLRFDHQRIVNFSCCHSEKAAKACEKQLQPFFSGAYYFKDEIIQYAKAIAAWTMFFYKQPSTDNHSKIAKEINTCLGGEVLHYMPYIDECVKDIERIAERGYLEALRLGEVNPTSNTQYLRFPQARP